MRKAQTLVEFAVSLTVFVLLLLGLVEAGRYAFSISTLTNAAREGARYATLRPYDLAGIIARVRSTVAGIDRNQVSVQVTYSPDPPQSGALVTVTVSYPFRPIFVRFDTPIVVRATMRLP
ncbi:MAG: hypothetical protein LKKZDAJK_000473 [Candidatus Fervidibacter sp.]